MTGLPDRTSYSAARDAAVEVVAGLDPARQAARCGGEYLVEGVRARIRLAYMGGAVDILLPGWEAVGPDGAKIDVYDEILVLRYLGSTARPQEAAEPISFSEMPSGEFYMPAFRRRAIAPLVAAFGQRPDLLAEASTPIGGRPAEGGDAAVAIPALPRIGITVVVWRGDDDLPAEASILMSGSAASYLSTEDVAVLCGAVATRLAREARKMAQQREGRG